MKRTDAVLEALKEMAEYHNRHLDACASQPTAISGAAKRGPCDCVYGRALKAIKEASVGQ